MECLQTTRDLPEQESIYWTHNNTHHTRSLTSQLCWSSPNQAPEKIILCLLQVGQVCPTWVFISASKMLLMKHGSIFCVCTIELWASGSISATSLECQRPAAVASQQLLSEESFLRSTWLPNHLPVDTPKDQYWIHGSQLNLHIHSLLHKHATLI